MLLFKNNFLSWFYSYTVATQKSIPEGGLIIEWLGHGVSLELEPTPGGLIIQCGRYAILT